MTQGKEPQSGLWRVAADARRARLYRRVLPSAAGAAVVLLVIVYLISLLFSRCGSFSIRIKDFQDHRYALSLSESDSFRQASSRLEAQAAVNITNIDGSELPDHLNDVDGAHNGENYLAYTFYVKNVGSVGCTYRYSLIVSQATAGVDAAARVRVYANGDYYTAHSNAYHRSGSYIDYAKPKTGGNGLPEIDPPQRVMTNFVNDSVVMRDELSGFAPGDISKFTVVIWLEGNDPDCTDDVLGGRFKVDMLIEIIGATAD